MTKLNMHIHKTVHMHIQGNDNDNVPSPNYLASVCPYISGVVFREFNLKYLCGHGSISSSLSLNACPKASFRFLVHPLTKLQLLPSKNCMSKHKLKNSIFQVSLHNLWPNGSLD